MILHVCAIGRLKNAHLQALSLDYENRLRHYVDLHVETLKDSVAVNKTVAQIQAEEGRRALDALPPSRFLVILDARGRNFSSDELAQFLEGRRQSGPREVAFCIGGPLGFAPEILQRADLVLSLSRMTFPHELTRIILLEQLYRAFTILHGEKYHKA